jgi:tetratricopeptide (TPR) repeat protein
MGNGNRLRAVNKEAEHRQAAAQFEAAGNLYQALGESENEAFARTMLGWAWSELGEATQAQASLQAALVIWERLKHSQGEAIVTRSLGHEAAGAKDWPRAMEWYERSYRASLKSADRSIAASVRNRIAEHCKGMDAPESAVKCVGQLGALQARSGDPDGAGATARSLHQKGMTFYQKGEMPLALLAFEGSLLLRRAVGDQGGEATTLNNIGRVYSALGEKQKALDYFGQALPLYRAVGDRSGEAMTLNNIGAAYDDLGEKQKAAEYYVQALPLHRAVSNRGGEAMTLSNIGLLFSELSDNQNALEHLSRALRLHRAVGDRGGEAITLSNIMVAWESQKQLRIAVYYGKQSVNRFQELRAAIGGLDKDLQRGFLKSKESTYRKLAYMLISLGRLPEAQQVLDLLKEEDYFGYLRRDGKEADQLKGRATLTPTEARLEKEYAEIADGITALGRELEELRRLAQPLPAQLARRTDLDAKLRLATERFQAYLGRLEKELGNSKDAGERLTQIQTSEGFQDTLRELGAGTVALYTVVSENRYSIILTPGSGPQVAAEANIPREELNKKIFALKDALRNPGVNPCPLAAEMYDLLLRPMEKNLEGAKAETLMFSLDGALRYLSMAALYDSKRGQYLIERYRVVIYTPAGATDLKNPARANWRGLGFGVSKAIVNEEVGSFRALGGVPAELRGVIRGGRQTEGVMEGEVYLDEQFTE